MGKNAGGLFTLNGHQEVLEVFFPYFVDGFLEDFLTRLWRRNHVDNPGITQETPSGRRPILGLEKEIFLSNRMSKIKVGLVKVSLSFLFLP